MFPEGCLVEVACGDEGEPEVWMPSQVIDIIPVEGKEEEALEKMVPEDVDAYFVSMLGNYDENENFEVNNNLLLLLVLYVCLLSVMCVGGS